MSWRRRDDGFAMISAVGIGMILTLLGITALALVVANAKFAGRSRRSNQAFHTADAGLNQAIFEIKQDLVPGGPPKTIQGTDPQSGTNYAVVIDRPDAPRAP